MPEMKPWNCVHCGAVDLTHDAWCPQCYHGRYPTRAIQIAEHVLEHIADGLAEPLDVLKAMQARVCYAKVQLELQFIASQMRLLTKDTTTLARALAKAQASRMMLNAVHNGSVAEHLAVLKGVQVLGEVVEHKVDQTTRFVIETHEGAPPAREDV